MKGFWKHVDQNEDQDYTSIVDQLIKVHTSWTVDTVHNIEIIASKSERNINFNDNTPIVPTEICNFSHYAKIVVAIYDMFKKQDRNRSIYFKVGSFIVDLHLGDLYCHPFYQDDKKFPDRQLCYATLKTSTPFNKHFSEILWNFIVGNHHKMYNSVLTPQDAIVVCAILFSEVIRYPNMFFHNILMMQHFKTWDDFCNYHPMVIGGAWKNQGKNRNKIQQGIQIPDKVKHREHENHSFFVKKMLEDKEKRCTPFQLKDLQQDDTDSS